MSKKFIIILTIFFIWSALTMSMRMEHTDHINTKFCRAGNPFPAVEWSLDPNKKQKFQNQTTASKEASTDPKNSGDVEGTLVPNKKNTLNSDHVEGSSTCPAPRTPQSNSTSVVTPHSVLRTPQDRTGTVSCPYALELKEFKKLYRQVLDLSLLTPTIAYSSEKKKKELIFGMHFSSTAGLGPAQLVDMVNILMEVIQEKTEITIKIERFSSEKDVFDAFVKGKINLIAGRAEDIILLREKGIELLGFLTYTVDKREKRARCLWQKKDKVYSSHSDIIGTTLLGDFVSFENTMFEMGQIRDYLYKQGIDKPLWKVFKSFTKVANSNSAFMAVGMGDADFYWDSDDYDFILKIMLPSIYTHISHKFCSERVFNRWTIVINKAEIDIQDYQFFIETLNEFSADYKELLKKYKNSRSFLQMAKTAKIEFVVTTSLPFAEEIKIWEKSKKNGWYEEAKFLADVLSKAENGKTIVVKPTYEYCKPKCLKTKEQIVCIEKCME